MFFIYLPFLFHRDLSDRNAPRIGMHLWHLLAGQAVLYMVFMMLIVFSEGQHIGKIIEYMSNLSLIRISDGKGVFYLLLSFSAISTGFLLEVIRSIARKNRNEYMRYKVAKSQRSMVYMLLVLYINFIGAYMFKVLDNRVIGFLIFGLLGYVGHSFSVLCGIDILSMFFYLSFVVANIFVFLLTYVNKFDIVFERFSKHFRRFEFLNQF